MAKTEGAKQPPKYNPLYGTHYDPTEILSYGRHLMMIIGARTIGKSTAIAILMLKNYLDHVQEDPNKNRFLYLRRTETELGYSSTSFFSDAVIILKEAGYEFDFKFYANKYFIRLGEDQAWLLAGNAAPLNKAEVLKSDNDLKGTKYILYDEFIVIDKARYLGNKTNFTLEFTYLNTIYGSLARDIHKAYKDDVYVFLLGNNASIYNPIILAKGIDKYILQSPRAHFIRPSGTDWIVEFLRADQVEATANYKDTAVYNFSNDELRAYTFDNNTLDSDINKYILKTDEALEPLYNLSYLGNTYGVYRTMKSGKLYITSKKNNLKTLALTSEDHDVNKFFIFHKTCEINILLEAYSIYNLYFSNNKIAINLLTYLGLIK